MELSALACRTKKRQIHWDEFPATSIWARHKINNHTVFMIVAMEAALDGHIYFASARGLRPVKWSDAVKDLEWTNDFKSWYNFDIEV